MFYDYPVIGVFDVKIHERLLYLILSIGMYLSAITDLEMNESSMAAGIFISFITYFYLRYIRLFVHNKFYLYIAHSALIGGLMGRFIATIVRRIGNPIRLLSTGIITIFIIVIWAICKNNYSKSTFEHYNTLFNKLTFFENLTMYVLCVYSSFILCSGVSFSYTSFAISIPLGGILMFIIYHQNVDKIRDEVLRCIDDNKRCEEYDQEYRWQQEVDAEMKERMFKDKYRQEKYGRSSSGYSQESSQQQEYEKWFNSQQETANDNRSQDNVTLNFFRGCKTLEELETRHRSLAKAYHPDSNAGDTESYQEMQEEYERLKEEMR